MITWNTIGMGIILFGLSVLAFVNAVQAIIGGTS